MTITRIENDNIIIGNELVTVVSMKYTYQQLNDFGALLRGGVTCIELNTTIIENLTNWMKHVARDVGIGSIKKELNTKIY